MPTINPYLNFDGNAEEAFNHYKTVFGGELVGLTRFKDMGGNNIPPEYANKLMHVSLPIGKGNILMATDAVEGMGHKYIPGNNFYVAIEADSKAEADRLYNELSAGGKIEMPISEAVWGAYFGMFSDRFGARWMVSYTHPKP